MLAVPLSLGEALRVLDPLEAESIDAERITRARQTHRSILTTTSGSQLIPLFNAPANARNAELCSPLL
jgi:hypothetical protein